MLKFHTCFSLIQKELFLMKCISFLIVLFLYILFRNNQEDIIISILIRKSKKEKTIKNYNVGSYFNFLP